MNILIVFCEIINKDLENIKSYSIWGIYWFDIDIQSAKASLVQLSDNFFCISTEDSSSGQKKIITFGEIRIKPNLLSTEGKIFDENEDDCGNAFINEREIEIEETGHSEVYSLTKENCGIAMNYKNYYICDLKKMEIILKINLNIDGEFHLLKFIEGNNKYRLYLNDDKNLLYISSFYLY